MKSNFAIVCLEVLDRPAMINEAGSSWTNHIETVLGDMDDVDIFDSYSPVMWFVSYAGTTQELSMQLLSDLDDELIDNLKLASGHDDPVPPTIVVPLKNYHGYASQSLWEWLESRRQINGF